LVDEDALLTEEDVKRPAPAPANQDDCEVGKAGRKACKDCTCGRAEAEAAGVKVGLTPEMLANPGAGSCGNVRLVGFVLGGWGVRVSREGGALTRPKDTPTQPKRTSYSNTTSSQTKNTQT
jgi:hypothetical protein